MFKCRLVLFIDHDESEVRSRREDSTAGSNDDFDVTASNLLPLPMSLRIAHVAVEHGDRIESAAKAPNRLRRQTDFRYKYDCLSAVANHLAN